MECTISYYAIPIPPDGPDLPAIPESQDVRGADLSWTVEEQRAQCSNLVRDELQGDLAALGFTDPWF